MTRSAGDSAAGGRNRPVERLRASGDVRAVFATRRAAASPFVVVHVRPREDQGPARATVVAGKKVGNAVQRNRAKRRLRAALPALGLRPSCDYVLVARNGALTASWPDLQAAVRRSVASAGPRP